MIGWETRRARIVAVWRLAGAISGIVGCAAVASAESTAAQPPPLVAAPTRDTEFGFSVFQRHCTACHGNPAVERAPTPAQLRQFTPERIYSALTGGPMKTIGDTLTDGERRQVSASLAGRPFGAMNSGDANGMPNRCPSGAAMADPANGPAWNGWGGNTANTRFQVADQAKIGIGNVGSLKFKWAFGFPNSSSAYSQPTVVAGRVFVGSDTGYVYSLDAKTGCVYWSYLSQAGVRNAMTVAPIRIHGRNEYAVFYGDLKANVYALDARTGALFWSQKVDPHYTDRVTAAPAFDDDTVYVPVSSWEEFAASSPDYPCCTSVGSVVALNARTGRRLWKTYAIATRPRRVRKNKSGVQQWAPAGASVWNTPTLDLRRRRLYVGTGDSTTYPASPTSDAVMALDMKTGKVVWSYQVFKHDSFLGSCPAVDKPENCPHVQGPDFDIPSSPILRRAPGGDVLLVGTKPGDVLALRPDDAKLLWRKNVFGDLVDDAPAGAPDGQPRTARGVQWGGTINATTAYYGLSGGGLAALRIADGERLWLSDLGVGGGTPSNNGAAATAVPGIIFVGGTDGILTAVSSTDGSVLWRYSTSREFTAVNGVPTKGGSIYAAGPVVSDGMVFVGSGYAVYAGIPGNALVAFGL